MIQDLAEGLRDDHHGTHRFQIGASYERLGMKEEAANWYLDSAKWAEFCETNTTIVNSARRAKALAPLNLRIVREANRLLGKYASRSARKRKQ